MESLLIRNGRLIDPSQNLDRIGDLCISEGKIYSLENAPPPDSQVLNAEGLIVCPGFIDFHCHLRQPGYEAKETIATGARAAARGGFTTVCCMPNTNPPLDSPEVIDYILREAAKEAVVRVLPIGVISRGRQGKELTDMGRLAAAGAVAFSDDGTPVSSSPLMYQALDCSRTVGLPVIDHCEDLTLSQGGQMHEGRVSLELGLQGIPSAAEENMVARNLTLAGQLPGSHLHIAHVSTEGSVELIRRAREKGVPVTAEVTPHHLTLTDEAVRGYNTDAKVSPPLRTERDIRALIGGLKEGVIDFIVTDHAPHAGVDKRCEFNRAASGISIFETALGSLMGLVHEGQLTLNMLISRLTADPAKIFRPEKPGTLQGGTPGDVSVSGPAKFFRPEKMGTLQGGAPGDVTIFDPDKEWLVDTADFVSKGKNTPLAGAVLKGKVMATVYGGKLVYRDEAIKLTTFQGNQ